MWVHFKIQRWNHHRSSIQRSAQILHYLRDAKPFVNLAERTTPTESASGSFFWHMTIKKAVKPTKLVATPLLFLCASHCVSNLYVNAVYNIFQRFVSTFLLLKTILYTCTKLWYNSYISLFIFMLFSHHHIYVISGHSPLLSINFIFSIFAHKFFTSFPLTSPHKCLIILSKLIN